MYLNPRLLRDVLTVEVFSPAAEDPNTGAPLDVGGSVVVLTQPCSDQDVSAATRAQYTIVNGVAGSLPVSICYTAWFDAPDLTDGQSLAYRVNGHYRPLLRQGPPIDLGAQQRVSQLILGAPEGNR